MPRKATGNVYESRGRWYARITLAKGERPSIPLPTCADERAAEARGAVLADLAARLRRESVPLGTARELVERAGKAAQGKALDKVLSAAAAICSRDARPKADPSKPVTFQNVGERWTSGELARLYPDHVKAKSTAERDAQRLERYVYPLLTGVPLEAFTIDHAEAVMRALPSNRVRTAATRRHIAQLMHRILGIAVFPLRLIKANPLPKGFLPKTGPSKAKGYLYPEDDARLLGCRDVPLDLRAFYGFLDREGTRASEAEALTWRDLDLDRGAVKLDENKTDDPRAWALSSGVAAGLRALRALREGAGAPAGPDDAVFILRADGKKYDAAKLFREHLRMAGVDRPELFERSASRLHIRRHDLRATFVTLNLAAGRTETWIADRTGHKSSDMINRYRRAARTAAELGLGELRPLIDAIPELAVVDSSGASSGKGGGKGGAEAPDSLSACSGTWIRTTIRGFKERACEASETEPAESPGNLGGDGSRSVPLANAPPLPDPLPALSIAAPGQPAIQAPPRSALLAALFDGARAAALSGDLEAARVANEAIGRLLGAAPLVGVEGRGGPVVDLGAERRKRGER